MACFYYLFGSIFLFIGIFKYIGGDLGHFCLILDFLLFLIWIVLIVYGLFKYRKIPLLVVFLIPFIVGFLHYNEYIDLPIFYNIQLPHYQQVVDDVFKKERSTAHALNSDNSKGSILTADVKESKPDIKCPFADGVKVVQIKGTDIILISFNVGSTGGFGTHWGYVYCSDGKRIDITNISKFFPRYYGFSKINEHWYSWCF